MNDAPTYAGPSDAERFCDDACARAALARHDLPIPPQLSWDSITRRYAFASTVATDGKVTTIHFLDGSVAGARGKRWQVAP